MIVTRTPFRITLGGGATDLPSFYEQHGGFVFSMAIDKYMYVSINVSEVDRKIRVHYTKDEVVDHPDQLQHELAREALKRHEIWSRMEISSMADLRAGTGLGSMSCYLVGLLSGLRTYRRELCSQQELAEDASRIEIENLRKLAGKQDPFMAVFGGMSVLEIDRDGTTKIRSAEVPRATLPDFIANTQMYFTGVRRNDPEVLREPVAALQGGGGAPGHEHAVATLQSIKDIGHRVLDAIESENYDEFGRLMDEHWQQKQRLSARVSIPGIEELYADLKKRFGVLGGKVCGAGGGGFFLVYAPTKHSELDEFMARHGLTRMHYGVEFEGAKVIANSGSTAHGPRTHEAIV